MSRAVCGICWCPYDEDGRCGCKPAQPEALRLADELEYVCKYSDSEHWETIDAAGAELRRLHEANAELLGTLKHARDLVAEWGAYASDYFQTKYGLALELKQLDAAIQRGEKT